MAEPKEWVPGYDEVLEKFDDIRLYDIKINLLKQKLKYDCWEKTSYIRKDPTAAYQDAPAFRRYCDMVEAQNDSLQRHIDNYLCFLEEIKMLIKLVKYPASVILEMYYIKRFSWVEVSFFTHYSEKQCKRIRNQAIAEIAIKTAGIWKDPFFMHVTQKIEQKSVIKMSLHVRQYVL